MDKKTRQGGKAGPTWTYSPWGSDESVWLKDKEQKGMSGDGTMEDINAECLKGRPQSDKDVFNLQHV